MRILFRLVVLGLAGYGGYSLYQQYGDRILGRPRAPEPDIVEIDVVEYEVYDAAGSPAPTRRRT
jgi:hypothetical protein